MRHLARTLLTLGWAIGLRALVLLGAVALVLGVVGSFRHVQARVRFGGDPAGPLIVVAAEPWVLQLGTIRMDAKGSAWQSVQGTQLRHYPNDWRGPLRLRLWFQHRGTVATASDGTRQTFNCIWVPFWIPVGAAGVIVVIWVRRRLIPARRAAAGLCPACGYDLRASSERCPECGDAMIGRLPKRSPA